MLGDKFYVGDVVFYSKKLFYKTIECKSWDFVPNLESTLLDRFIIINIVETSTELLTQNGMIVYAPLKWLLHDINEEF